MSPDPRPAASPLPGDLYFDPAVPERERVSLSRNGWSAEATHVWTGTGWSRLVAGLVRDVPAHPEVTLPCVPAPRAAAVAQELPVALPSTAGIERYRRRRAARESVAELVRERGGSAESTAG